MAKGNKKNDVKLTSTKKKSTSTKKSSADNLKTKKSSNTKKKLIVPDQVKKEEIKETELVKKATKKKTSKETLVSSNTVDTKKELDIKKKERNRKKYENQQKKYQESQKPKTKKKIIVPDQVVDNQKEDIKEEPLLKKVKVKELKTSKKEKEKERKEKRKFNRKSIHLTQTFVNIKDKSVNKINYVKEKTNDKHIPIGKSKEEKKRRFKRLVKEAIVYAIILTFINIICVLIFDYFNFLRLFDVKVLNVIVTIVVSLIFNFFIAFMIDYFTTEIWLKKKRKKEDGVLDGNSGVNKGEYQENIKDKE